MESVLNEVAQELGERASVGIVTPEERPLFQTFQVRSVPTILLVRDGNVKKTYVGVVTKEVLIRDLEQFGPGASTS